MSSLYGYILMRFLSAVVVVVVVIVDAINVVAFALQQVVGSRAKVN